MTDFESALTRARSPLAEKQFIAPFVLDPAAHLAEPLRFELLRTVRHEEFRLLDAQFATLPSLPTPPDLHHNAVLVSWSVRRNLRQASVLGPELLATLAAGKP